ILEDGKIDICVEISKDEERTLCTVEPTVILGEMSMLLNRPRTATAIANTDVRLWKVAHAKFQEGIQNRDGWAVKLLAGTSQVLARRVAAMNEELVAQINDLRRLQAE